MRRIQDEKCDELGEVSDEKKIRLYLDEYIPFCEGFTEIEGRKVDKALWARSENSRNGTDLHERASWRLAAGG
jgi:hypothetical protein